MKIFLQSFLLLLFITTSRAQTFQEISCGAGYNKQSYVSLATGEQKTVDNDAWDIAFTAYGVQDAGIFINESSGSISGQNIPVVEVYYTDDSDFNTVFDVAKLKDNSLLNDELSWNYGAFNGTRDTLNPFDFGWGSYEPASHGVVGNQVFVLKLRNGTYKKLIIESLIGTNYIIKYANLDGTNLVSKTLSKTADSYGKGFVFYNLSTNSIVDVLPSYDYDLMYGRYISIAKDPNGTIVQQYNVTGVLTGPKVLSVMADGVDVNNVSYKDYQDQLSSRLDVIGYDWKSFTGTGWELDADRVFFLQSKDKTVWKLQFIDFEGSSTGTAVLTKENIGIFNATTDANIASIVYPNPTADFIYIMTDRELQNIHCYDVNGRRVDFRHTVVSEDQFYVYSIDVKSLQGGIYIVKGQGTDQSILTTKFIKSN